MRISIEHLQKEEGGTLIVAFLKRPTCLSLPSAIASNRSNSENAAAYEVELELLQKARTMFEEEDAEYTHLHLGDAELMQDGETNE